MKQAERVPVLSIKASTMYQRRTHKQQETMAESWEALIPDGKN